jgi:hypothetical protein
MRFGGLSLEWTFFAYLTVVVATAGLLHYARRSPRFFSLVSLPGTLGHESLHWLIGTLALARPMKVSLIPKFHRDGSATLGFVAFSNIRWYNALWVGFAPLLALPVALWLVYHRSAHIPPLSPSELAWAYVAASLAYSCLPSKADVRIVLSRPVGLVVYLCGAAILFWQFLA